MNWKKEIDDLKTRVSKIERTFDCLAGRHRPGKFYDFGETTIPGSYYIRFICDYCGGILQYPITKEQLVSMGVIY
jgi:hypothetical protein